MNFADASKQSIFNESDGSGIKDNKDIANIVNEFEKIKMSIMNGNENKENITPVINLLEGRNKQLQAIDSFRMREIECLRESEGNLRELTNEYRSVIQKNDAELRCLRKSELASVCKIKNNIVEIDRQAKSIMNLQCELEKLKKCQLMSEKENADLKALNQQLRNKVKNQQDQNKELDETIVKLRNKLTASDALVEEKTKKLEQFENLAKMFSGIASKDN